MKLTKQDLFLIFGCFGQQAAEDDKQIQFSAEMTIGKLVTASDAEKLQMLEAMQAAVLSVYDQLPSVMAKIQHEMTQLKGGAL